jgi:hypothetical protein
MSRAEWHDSENRMRPRDQVIAHLEMYARLMEDNGLGAFPESFVPCAGRYRFGAADGGLDAILRSFGVRYSNTPFSCAGFDRPPQHTGFAIAEGVVTLDRGDDAAPWFAIAHEPTADPRGPVYGLHWPNILHIDPAQSDEVVDRWIEFFKPLRHRLERMLAPDTAECWTQYLHHACVEVKAREDRVELDFSRLDSLAEGAAGDSFTLKIEAADARPVEWKAEGVEVVGSEYDGIGGNRALRLRRGLNVRVGSISW